MRVSNFKELFGKEGEKRIILGLVFSLVFSLLVTSEEVEAGGASLSIFPQTGTFTVGSTFEVSVFLNTGGESVNVVKADLRFDREKLQVVTPAKGLSVVEEWIFPPSFSNTAGSVTLVGGFPEKGINSSEGLVTIIVFQAISVGKTALEFLDSSQVLVGSADGANILNSVNRAVFEIVPSPYKGPRIFSETHPDQNVWYGNNTPTFSWEKTSEDTGYSYSLDENFAGEPDNNIDSRDNSVSFEDVNDGIQYFHLKARKAEVWSGTSHYKVMIDRTPPLEFWPYLELSTLSFKNYLLIGFVSRDLLSGLDHYRVRISDLTDPKNVLFTAWTIEESPFHFETGRKGIFELGIRAFDKAGNFQEGKIKIRIISPFLILTSRGLIVKSIFLSWRNIFLLILLMLLLTGLFIFLIKRKKVSPRIRLDKEIREAEKEIEDVRRAEEELSRIREEEERAGQEWRRLKGNLEEEVR